MRTLIKTLVFGIIGLMCLTAFGATTKIYIDKADTSYNMTFTSWAVHSNYNPSCDAYGQIGKSYLGGFDITLGDFDLLAKCKGDAPRLIFSTSSGTITCENVNLSKTLEFTINGRKRSCVQR